MGGSGNTANTTGTLVSVNLEMEVHTGNDGILATLLFVLLGVAVLVAVVIVVVFFATRRRRLQDAAANYTKLSDDRRATTQQALMTSFSPDQHLKDLVDDDPRKEQRTWDLGVSQVREVATLFLPIDLFMVHLQSAGHTTNSFSDSGWESFMTSEVQENDLSRSSTDNNGDEAAWNIESQNTPTKTNLVYVNAETSFHDEDFGHICPPASLGSPSDDGFFSVSLDHTFSLEASPPRPKCSTRGHNAVNHDNVLYSWLEEVDFNSNQDFVDFRNSFQGDGSEPYEQIEMVAFRCASPDEDVMKSYVVIEMS